MNTNKRARLISLIISVTLLVSVNIMVPLVSNANNSIYYVDSVDGDDNNSGKSDGAPWRSLDKINATTFEPGDKILFKGGSSWTGELWPKGSGASGYPIVIDRYGENNQRPVIHIPNTNPSSEDQATQGVKLFNQEYWEIRGLEIVGPNTSTNAYRRGIHISAENYGVIHNIYLGDLYIHDIRGMGTGMNKKDKWTGGIIMEVTGDPDEDVPTYFDGVKIENNHISHVGRTGIKAIVSKWMELANRYPDINQTKYYPHRNLVISNNYIEHIAGDGMIVRGCLDAVVEYNVVYSCQETSPFAAGIFSWKSDNTIIQYNEAYLTHRDADGQGIEIDGLNIGNIMQYNYSHDNDGGFTQVCTAANYPSYDSIIRYNISQNDKNIIFENRPWSYNSLFYNNTIYTKAGMVSPTFADGNYGGSAKIYNNIWVNEGTTSSGPWNESYTEYSNNCFYGNFSSYPNDPALVTANPMLAAPGTGGDGVLGDSAIDTLDGYELQGASSCINQGKIIDSNGGKDYFGNDLYKDAPDIGAHEYQGTVVIPDWILPSEDTFIRGGQYGNDIYGSEMTMGVKDAPTVAYDRWSYLKFDISSIEQDVDEVIFKAYGRNVQSSDAVVVKCYSSNDITWSEEDVTYNNAPEYNEEVLAEAVITDHVSYYEWDVTAYVLQQMEAGHNQITLVLVCDTGDAKSIQFNTKEHVSNNPKLIVN